MFVICSCARIMIEQYCWPILLVATASVALGVQNSREDGGPLSAANVKPSAQELRSRERELQQASAELYRPGSFSEAAAATEQLCGIRKQLVGENHESYAASFNNLTEVYRAQGQYRRSQEAFEKATAILHTCLGESDSRYALTISNPRVAENLQR